jgi:signal transduction histidine kinase
MSTPASPTFHEMTENTVSAPAEPTRPTDLMAMVSHDLRTPLASVKEALSLLSETAGTKLDEPQRRYLAVAREEIDRLNRMIDNLIEVSRLDCGRVILHIEAVDLTEVLSSAIESLSLLVGKRGLVIERTIPSDLPLVPGDRDRLVRVFNNTLDNAIKYSPQGGTIRVRLASLAPGAGVLMGKGLRADSRYVQATVSDEGPGIPADAIERVFGRFERVDPYGPGTGLGLAIVRSIIEMHHGRVWVESEPGKGTSLQFILPVKENS